MLPVSPTSEPNGHDMPFFPASSLLVSFRGQFLVWCHETLGQLHIFICFVVDGSQDGAADPRPSRSCAHRWTPARAGAAWQRCKCDACVADLSGTGTNC